MVLVQRFPAVVPTAPAPITITFITGNIPPTTARIVRRKVRSAQPATQSAKAGTDQGRGMLRSLRLNTAGSVAARCPLSRSSPS
jgi:hypothetical protein